MLARRPRVLGKTHPKSGARELVALSRQPWALQAEYPAPTPAGSPTLETPAPQANVTSLPAAMSAVESAVEFTSHEWIAEVDVPTAVVITTADDVVPPSRQRRLARAIPHAAVFELIGDHAVILNDPARFAQVLIAASRSVTGAIAGQAVGGEPA